MSPTQNAYDDPLAVAAWQRAATTRAAYLAEPTRRMLELARIAPGSRVLVVGGGTGEDAMDVAERTGAAGEVVATDVSAAMVRKAAQTVAGAGNVLCAVVDAQHIAFASRTFDAVVSRNALMFVPDLGLALEEIKRVLKPGGRLAATVWSSAARNPRLGAPLAAGRRLGARPGPGTTYRVALGLGSKWQTAAALRRARFSDVTVERCPVTARYSGLEAAVAEAMDHAGTHELLRLLPDGFDARLRQSLLRRWKRLAASGPMELPGEQLVIGGGTAPVV